MASLVIDDTYLPAILRGHPMTDEEFEAFCAEHPDLNFEMTADGEIIAMAPANSFTGASNFEAAGELRAWARKDRRGIGFDSSTGFVLPNGARRSPDASWILRTRALGLEPRKRKGFWHICPDFVIEIKSESDRLRPLKAKMREYLDNGAQLGWLIDPQQRKVEVYRLNGQVIVHANLMQLEGEGPVAGFVLDLKYVWDPLAD